MENFFYRRALYVGVLILGVVLLVGIFIFFDQKSNSEMSGKVLENQSKIVADAADAINAKNYDIMVFGEDIQGPANLKTRRVNGFKHEAICGSLAPQGVNGRMIIYNDPHGIAGIDEDQLNDLVDRIKNDNVTFIYIGKTKFNMFKNAGIASGAEGAESYIVFNNGKEYINGIAEDGDLMPKNLEMTLTKEQRSVYTVIINLTQSKVYEKVW
ncbi:hypothetical protein SAMN02910456_01050 [Ruminococcaceae bacterium YRB3002]|nr:hypothetical protein SAMN02910456_01050 [Ruminococcaceae bacterium YRB3002]